jgi:hypothetical protein
MFLGSKLLEVIGAFYHQGRSLLRMLMNLPGQMGTGKSLFQPSILATPFWCWSQTPAFSSL